MRPITMFQVYKFFPPKCPKCGKAFSSNSDFSWWLGNGNSFTEAMKNQKEHFPEIFPKTTLNTETNSSNPLAGVAGYSNRFEIDFIACNHCQNVTMRIGYSLRQVATLEEAEMLVKVQGFTGWQEVQTFGNMARPFEKVAMLGQAELLMLQKATEDARNLVREEKDMILRGDIFSSTLDPVLIDTVKRIGRTRVSKEIRENLHSLFGVLWEKVSPESQQFLIDAELFKNDHISYSETDPSIDFTPAVQMYSKALEKELLDKIFIAFRNSNFSSELPESTGNNSLDRSLDAIKAFVEKRRNIALGEMAFCLLNIGCKMRDIPNNGFVKFLKQNLVDFNNLCDSHKLPARINKYTEEYRNRAAHVGRLTREDCLGARAFLFDEPIRLLMMLEESFVAK